jgi:TatD DNase family protein
LLKKFQMFIDTHAHIYSEEFAADADLVVRRAAASGIQMIVMPSIDRGHFEQMTMLASKFPDFLIPLIGIHPSSIKTDYEAELEFVENELQKGKYRAIGEIGIDLYWDTTYVSQQIDAFEKQLQLALKYKLPVVIHQRESFSEILSVIGQDAYKGLKGVFHCYAGDVKTAEHLTEKGFLLGIGGVVTYKNSMMSKVVAEIDLDYLVLETDAPYLPPVPYRGKRNEPSYIPVIAEKIAEIKLLDVEEVAQRTTVNAIRLFGL